jgi:hypothetical protein
VSLFEVEGMAVCPNSTLIQPAKVIWCGKPYLRSDLPMSAGPLVSFLGIGRGLTGSFAYIFYSFIYVCIYVALQRGSLCFACCPRFRAAEGPSGWG